MSGWELVQMGARHIEIRYAAFIVESGPAHRASGLAYERNREVPDDGTLSGVYGRCPQISASRGFEPVVKS